MFLNFILTNRGTGRLGFDCRHNGHTHDDFRPAYADLVVSGRRYRCRRFVLSLLCLCKTRKVRA